MNDLLDRLTRDFGITDITPHCSAYTSVRVTKDKGERLIRELRDREGFTHLSFMTCTDWIEQGAFRLTYMLHNHALKQGLAVQVDLDREHPEMTSIHKLWAIGWAFQRELREMYGIRFPDSPRQDENFCLEGWDAMPPMRRDFNTAQYSAEVFGHREGRESLEPREHMKEQFYPDRGGDAQ